MNGRCKDRAICFYPMRHMSAFICLYTYEQYICTRDDLEKYADSYLAHRLAVIAAVQLQSVVKK